MLKRIITCLLALSLLAGVQVSFAAEKAGAEAGQISKTERSQYPHAYEKAILAAKSEIPATAEYQGMLIERKPIRRLPFRFSITARSVPMKSP